MRSSCLKHPVGVLLVQKGKVVATAYNRVPYGSPECSTVGCMRRQYGVSQGERAELCRGLHAEQALITHCLKNNISLEGGIIYCNRSPCAICARLLADLNIQAYYFTELRKERLFEEIFQSAGVFYKQEDIEDE